MTARSMTLLILQRLQEIRARLEAQDETLTTVRLWPNTLVTFSSTYIAMFLEDTQIQRALGDCLTACAESRVVTCLHIGNLPEPDLEAALLTLAEGLLQQGSQEACALQEIHIGPLHTSCSLSGKVLTKFLSVVPRRLTKLQCSCRIRLSSQSSIRALGQALRPFKYLRHVYIHVVPRTSIQQPSLRLDALLTCWDDLQSFELTAGYPEHNPYQRPMVSIATIDTLMQKNSGLTLLSLSNLGLQSEHIRAITSKQWPVQLRELRLPNNPHLLRNEGEAWAQPLAAQLEHPQHTNLRIVLVSGRGAPLSIDMWTTFNRMGRASLFKASEGSAAQLRLWQKLMIASSCSIEKSDCYAYDFCRSLASQSDPTPLASSLLPLNLHFTLIRQHPILAVQSLKRVKS